MKPGKLSKPLVTTCLTAHALLFLAIGLFLCGCSPVRNPQKVAERFLHAYFSHDFQQAIRWSDESTAEELTYIQSLMAAEGLSEKEMQASAQPVLIEVHQVIVDGDSAICNYTVKTSRDDANAMSDNLILKLKNGSWVVVF